MDRKRSSRLSGTGKARARDVKHRLTGRAGAAAIALAAMTAAAPQTAWAQFVATPEIVTGGVSVVDDARVIVVETPFARIDWFPEQGSGDIDFLPAGNTVTFWDGGRTGEFTVLNRIVPSDLSRRAVFSGVVDSLVGSERGGTVWFYNPGGILVNSSGVFDVGNLLLSAGAIGGNFPTDDTTLTAAPAFQGTLTIDADPGSTAAVTNLGLLRTSGYAAMVGPRVAQAGNIRAGGTAAMVAAQSAVLTVSLDLFDIQVTVAPFSDPENPSDNLVLSHTGETLSNGAEGTGPHRVYLATMAASDPLTLLLGGTVQATDAVLTENGIVLSTGGGIIGGAAVSTSSAAGRVDVVIDAAPPALPPDPADSIYPHLADGGIEISATGNIIARPGAAVLSGSDILLRSDRDVEIGAGARFAAGYDGPGSGPQVDQSADLGIEAASTIAGGGVLEGAGSVTLLADAIALDEALVSSRNPGLVSAVAETGGIAIGSIDAAGDLLVDAPGDVALGTVAVAGTRADIFSRQAGIGIGTVEAEQADFVASAAADVVLQGDRLAAGTIAIDTPGQFRTLANSATVQASGSIALPATEATGSLSVVSQDGPVALGGPILAGGTLLVDSGSLLTVSETIDAPEIELRSADIAIGPDGLVGAGGGSVVLQASGVPAVAIGEGVGSEEAYILDGAELGRVRGTSVAVIAGPADVTVGNATVDAGNVGALRIESEGSVSVTGTLALAGAGQDNSLEIVAGQRLDVVTPGGSIAVRDAAGGLAGSLLLSANNILVADASVRALSLEDPLFADREALLSTDGGLSSAEGFVSAGSIALRAGESLHVRNTGDQRRFGGLSARSFSISATGDGPADVIVYGRSVSLDGTIVDDFRLRDLVALDGTFTPESAINGCRINVGRCDDPFIITGPTIEALVDPGSQGPLATVPRLPSVQLLNTSELDFTDEPLVTEPVTGAGSLDALDGAPQCTQEGDARCP